MKKYFHFKTIIFLAFAVLIVILISFFYRPASPLPQVISTLPAEKSNDVLYDQPITIVFDMPVDPSLIQVTSVPEESWTVKAGNGTAIILEHAKYFHVDYDYQVDLSYQGKPLYTLSFHTLPQQSDPRYTQSVVNQIEHDYPLASKLPAESGGVRVLYDSPLTLSVILLNPNLAEDQALEAARQIVANFGLDPASHAYIFASPTPAP